MLKQVLLNNPPGRFLLNAFSAGATAYFAKKKMESLISDGQNHVLLHWTNHLIKVNPKFISVPVALLALNAFTEELASDKEASWLGGIAGLALQEFDSRMKCIQKNQQM